MDDTTFTADCGLRKTSGVSRQPERGMPPASAAPSLASLEAPVEAQADQAAPHKGFQPRNHERTKFHRNGSPLLRVCVGGKPGISILKNKEYLENNNLVLNQHDIFFVF